MPFIIDGHNLIPKVGLRLDSMEDELELVELLQVYCRIARRRVEVYFDGAPAGQVGARRMGAVTAHFVARRSSADEAIRTHLGRLGKSARNWTVVSSDREVRQAASSVHAQAQTSEDFAAALRHVVSQGTGQKGGFKDPGPDAETPAEIQRWLELFKNR